MKNTWQLINELRSKNTGTTNRVSELNFNNQEITEPMSIAEAFNNYFWNVGDKLAATIPTPDHDPSFYFKATDNVFSLQIPTFETVFKLLSEIDEKKAVGLDNIPNKLLKMAARVVAATLTGIYFLHRDVQEYSQMNGRQAG